MPIAAGTRALWWAVAAGLLMVCLNSLLRVLATSLGAPQAQLLRYAFGAAMFLPLVAHGSPRAFVPANLAGQFLQGAVLTAALLLWFVALPHVTIADTTAIAFTSPIFVMLGATLIFKERLRWDRSVAALVGLTGVLIVVLPKVTAGGNLYILAMLASSPAFAIAFLITKGLTRRERPSVIVLWQSITVAVFSLPLAAWSWKSPDTTQWLLCAACGVLGTCANYCLTKAFATADISAVQSVKFLELVWATLIGSFAFGDTVSRATVVGGCVICASTAWIMRREARTDA